MHYILLEIRKALRAKSRSKPTNPFSLSLLKKYWNHTQAHTRFLIIEIVAPSSRENSNRVSLFKTPRGVLKRQIARCEGARGCCCRPFNEIRVTPYTRAWLWFPIYIYINTHTHTPLSFVTYPSLTLVSTRECVCGVWYGHFYYI